MTAWISIFLSTISVFAAVLITEAESVQLVHIGIVASDVIGLTIRSDQNVEYGRQIPYTKQEGDKVEDKELHRWVYRNRQFIGSLVGAEEKLLHTPDRLAGESLDVSPLEKSSNWRITSLDDPNYAKNKGLRPKSIYRKSRPTDMIRTDSWKFEAPVEHTLYLKLPYPLQQGKHYTLTPKNTSLDSIEFIWDSVLMILPKSPLFPAGWEMAKVSHIQKKWCFM